MKKLDKTIARQALWRRGYLPWKDHAAQKLIEAAFQARRGTLFVANCSRRIGKTHWDAKKAIEYALDPDIKRPRIKVASAFLNDLEEFTIPAFMDRLEDCPPDVRPQWLSTKKKWKFWKTGGEIKLIGLDKNPNGLRGNYADLVVFEEAGLVNRLDYLYSSVCVPMTAYRPKPAVVMTFTPPETPDHPVKSFSEKAKIERAYIELDIDQNPLLTQEDKARLLAECLTETERLREYYCKFVVDASRAIIPEWREAFIVDTPRDEFFPLYHKYEGMDLGVVDFTAALFAYYDFRRRTLVVEDEIGMRGPEMTTKILNAVLREKEKELWNYKDAKVYRRIADNNNLLLLNDLNRVYGMAFHATTKDSLEAMVNEVRIWFNEGRIEVNPRCTHLIGCLNAGIWNEKRTEFERSAVFGHFDWLAALIYLVRNVDKITNPIPATYGTRPDTHYVNPEPVLSYNADLIRKTFLKKRR